MYLHFENDSDFFHKKYQIFKGLILNAFAMFYASWLTLLQCTDLMNCFFMWEGPAKEVLITFSVKFGSYSGYKKVPVF